MIICRSPGEIEKLRSSARLVRQILYELRDRARPGVATLELENFVEKRLKEFLGRIAVLAKTYKKVAPLEEKYKNVNAKKRPKDHRRYRFNLARSIVRTSLAVRNLPQLKPWRRLRLVRLSAPVSIFRI